MGKKRKVILEYKRFGKIVTKKWQKKFSALIKEIKRLETAFGNQSVEDLEIEIESNPAPMLEPALSESEPKVKTPKPRTPRTKKAATPKTTTKKTATTTRKRRTTTTKK